MSTQRLQRGLEKAARFIRRLEELRASAPHDPDALAELEELVLIRRGSSETDYRQQLTLVGLQSAFEAYLATDAPRALDYAASVDPDALLADEALRELRAEYPDEAATLSAADVAAAVRSWAAKIGA